MVTKGGITMDTLTTSDYFKLCAFVMSFDSKALITGSDQVRRAQQIVSGDIDPDDGEVSRLISYFSLQPDSSSEIAS